ncbi:MAG: site-specific integrase [Tannerella sp.]|nr:site-specific integrase [Tannerella sp.]
MSTTISVICYKSKTLANGDNPLMIRVCKDRKTKYQSLGISVNPDHWDFEKNKPKPNCPNKELILKIILQKEMDFQKQILELKSEDREFTASTLIAPKVKKKTKTVSEFYEELIKSYELANKIGNSRIYKDSYHSLKNFTGNPLDMPFSHIDDDFLKQYEKWLRKNKCAETTMSLYFRTLRSAYNKAIGEKHVKKTDYPFNEFRISRFNTKTEKRAILKENVKQIIDLDFSNDKNLMQLSQDLFIFSYLCGGMNFADMANLTPENIINGRLSYVRQKTHKKITVSLSANALAIIEKYRHLSNGYLFPILDSGVHITEIQKYNRKKKVLKSVNYRLKKLSKILGMNTNLTTYVARHSFATVLKRSGVNIALISEALGHNDLATTQIYLDSFENEQIDAAMSNLL